MAKLFKKREFKIDFIRQRMIGYILSTIMLIVSVVSLCTQGLNYGIDFEGGILIEASSEQAVNLDETRTKLSFLRDLSIQTAGVEGKTILIQAKPETNDNPNALVEKIKATLGEGYTLSALPTSVDTTLNFHNGGYWDKVDSVYVNHSYVLFYETSSSLTGFNYAYKVGLNYDEELEMYYVNQVITNSNIALDATNLLSQYFLIINTAGCADGFTWAKTLNVGDYIKFSSDIKAVSAVKGEGTELTAKVYSGYEKYFYVTSNNAKITLPVLEKFGYKFDGWYTSDDFTGDPITEYVYQSTEAECTFYAKWTVCVLTASMIMNNGAGSTTADHSLSADGLTLTYDYVYVSGTNSFVVFQVYVDGVATSMSNKWTASYSNTKVLASWSNWSSMAAIMGAGTCTVTLTYNADPSIKVSFTATLVDGSAA